MILPRKPHDLESSWDEVWRAVEEAGVGRPYLPIGKKTVSYGQMVVDRVEELRSPRLMTVQILAIAALIRAVAKADVQSNNDP